MIDLKMVTKARTFCTVLIIIFPIAFLNACGGGGSSTSLNNGQIPQGQKGNIILPTATSLDFTKLTVSGALKEVGVDKDGHFLIELNKENVQLVTAHLENGDPFLLSIEIKPDNQNITLNTFSTAKALIFLHPVLVSSDSIIAKILLDYIEKLEETKNLALLLEQKLAKDLHSLVYEDEEIRSGVSKAVNRVLEYLDYLMASKSKEKLLERRFAESFKKSINVLFEKDLLQKEVNVAPETPKSGIQIHEISDANDVYEFYITNNVKRYIDVYIMYPEGNQYIYPSNALKTRIASAPGFINGIFKGGLLPPSKSDTLYIDFATLKFDSVKLRFFGLGTKWNNFDSKDKEKLIWPFSFTIIFDFAIPFIEVVTGINAPTSPGPGRPLYEPLEKSLVNYLATPIYDKLIEKVLYNDCMGFFIDLISGYLKYLLNNPKYIHDFLINCGVSGLWSIAKAAIMPLKTIFIITSAFDIGRAVLGLNNEVVEDFVIFTGKGSSYVGEFPLFTPDPDDKFPLKIVQTIPTNGASDIDPSNSIYIFFDDEINPITVNDYSIQVYVVSTGERIYGQYSGELSTAGNSILKFVPFKTLPENQMISVRLVQVSGIEDDGGNKLESVFEFRFTTKNKSPVVPANNLGFEIGNQGWSCAGDCNIILSPVGVIFAPEGMNMAVITTGDKIVSENSSLSGTTSSLTSGDIYIPPGMKSLTFNYNFVSAEFDEWVGSKFDDVFVIAISGPLGSYATVVNSVNKIGVASSEPINLPNSYTLKDSTLQDANHTGFLKYEIDISLLGNPIRISFSVSDVGDTIYSSIVFIDNIEFK